MEDTQLADGGCRTVTQLDVDQSGTINYDELLHGLRVSEHMIDIQIDASHISYYS